jgi:hypothetical protein
LRRSALEGIATDQPADLYHELVEEWPIVGLEVMRRFYEIVTPTGLEEPLAYL